MKVHVTQPPDSCALKRVALALAYYAPDFVEFTRRADIFVLHVIGRQDSLRRTVARLMRQGKRYAIIQYCLRSTQRPNCDGWLPIWRGAELVWSYYDLPALCREDDLPDDFNFYHAPLGVSRAFEPHNVNRHYIAMSCGLSWLTESVREIHLAARQTGRESMHLGPKMPDVFSVRGISDNELAGYYSQCEFVSGLRRTEGFELPAAEGLLCGARPILFDRPHYRQWYDPWGVFIPEEPREQVIESLVEVFNEGTRPVTDKERRAARALFDWQWIARGFWERLITS